VRRKLAAILETIDREEAARQREQLRYVLSFYPKHRRPDAPSVEGGGEKPGPSRAP
jgi:hypothetical protein